MLVGCYLRVSTIDQAEEGYSIEQQKDKLKQYCEVKDWDVYKFYIDAGFSGSNINRPAMQELIEDVNNNKIDTVLVYKLDRLSRSQKDTLYLIEDVFNVHKTAFVSLNENFDTSTAFGKASIGILSVFAQLEREQIKERMQMGKMGRAKTGKAMNWWNPAFGYIYNGETYDIDEFKADIIKKIYKDYLSGTSINKIAENLNKEGHLGKDKQWSFRTVRMVLVNSDYTGNVKYHGKIYAGQHSQIIDEKTFKTTQKELKIRQQEAYSKNNNPRPFQSKYMLSGLLECKYCSCNLTLVQYRPRKDGTHLSVYKCPSTMRKKMFTQRQLSNCISKTQERQMLEEHVINAISELQSNTSKIDSMNKTKLINIDSYKTELGKIEKSLKKLVNIYVDTDSLTIDIFNEKKEALLLQKDAIDKKIKSVKKNQPDLSVSDAKNILDKIEGNIAEAKYDMKYKIVRKLIKKIIVGNSRIVIKWAFEL
ncbi:recombinase family protein [Liquorilactobacillus mali]|uniref:Site-specific integrase n=1 Tax=Liquorilactobacillus mali KCTC 3596 = DSM 20444 TaxID=1046596 RepID=J0URN5_9LACO|nr:recombinase family protein [Liquorilactobacillus mali]EJE99198.1 site-specific integrase [Liquorilactobacillus mali KCTC 3596 = DSM 20444]KRN08707.1 site-specific integrase [Liquorilactobacillus mali KCTC 3596 = DSM 20444]QFQ75177.1 recombinase family protein [Liquorilactobacillus mali]